MSPPLTSEFSTFFSERGTGGSATVSTPNLDPNSSGRRNVVELISQPYTTHFTVKPQTLAGEGKLY